MILILNLCDVRFEISGFVTADTRQCRIECYTSVSRDDDESVRFGYVHAVVVFDFESCTAKACELHLGTERELS